MLPFVGFLSLGVVILLVLVILAAIGLTAKSESDRNAAAFFAIVLLVGLVCLWQLQIKPRYADARTSWEHKTESKREQQAYNEVILFSKKKVGDLHSKIKEIEQGIEEAESSKAKLEDLKKRFPARAAKIDLAIGQWQQVSADLSRVHSDIVEQLKDAYVQYKIDEVQGRKSFERIRAPLMDRANQALASAQSLRRAIDETSW